MAKTEFTELYKQIFRSPEVFYEGFSDRQMPVENLAFLGIRTGTRKGLYITNALESSVSSLGLIPPEWEEDKETEYLHPGLRAAKKLDDEAGAVLGLTKEREAGCGEVLSMATDVELIRDEQILKRPLRLQTDEEACQMLSDLLVADKPLEFQYQINVAVLNHHQSGQSNLNKGVTFRKHHSIRMEQFSQADVIQYLMDIGGVEGCKRTPSGVRFPHPIFASKILEIDGVQKDDPQFEQVLLSLFRSILGTPVELPDLLQLMANPTYLRNISEESNLYSELNGSWRELVALRNGDLVILESITPDDYCEISDLARENFLYAANYRDLDEEIRQRYIQANTPNGIADLCSNQNNLCTIKVRNAKGQILGYRVVRHGDSRIANGRRLHSRYNESGVGIGHLLMSRSEEFAKQKGYSQMEVHATGESHSWFAHQGYAVIERVEDKNGVFANGKPGSHVVMRKDLSVVL